MATNRNLDLFTLECFDMLMRERSVSRATERMDLSQSSMSEVLARLRDRLGDPLLVRTREGMVPTERATALLPQVRCAIDQLRLIVECVFRAIVDGHFAGSWTAFQANVDAASRDRGRRFTRSWTACHADRGRSGLARVT